MLEFTVFLCGALVMILEMTGARVLAPHVGTSAIVWTSLIGVVLGFLAAGAWIGGKFADKKLSASGLGLILACAGAGSALTALFHATIGAGITSHINNLYLAAVMAAIGIFALPAIFFGMITPYITRLKIANVNTAGATVGRLYALSTAGSILGTFLGGFILISWFSSSSILWGTSICLIGLSLANSRERPWFRIILLAICLFLAWQDHTFLNLQADRTGRILIESPYNSIRVMKAQDATIGGEEVVLMATDPGYSQSGAIVSRPDELYFNYTRFYGLGPALMPEAKSILMLGGGGYSVPKWLLSGKSALAKKTPDVLKIVEIDPVMTKTAKTYFGLKDSNNINIIHEDARAFLNRQTDKFDIIFMDVFNSHYSIPFQMGTLEAVTQLERALSPGGIILINLISAIQGEDGRLFRSIWSNLKKVFTDIRIYCVGTPLNPDKVQNLMILASNAPIKNIKKENLLREDISPGFLELTSMEHNLYKGIIPEDVPPLTDNFAPVERYTLMLARH